jgi:hypothetical protein
MQPAHVGDTDDAPAAGSPPHQTFSCASPEIGPSSAPRADFNQMGPHLLEPIPGDRHRIHADHQIPALLHRQRLDELLFGGGEDVSKADPKKVADQVGWGPRSRPPIRRRRPWRPETL